MKTCTKDNCQKKHYGKGLCRDHYYKWKYDTDPEYRQKRIMRSAKSKSESLKDPRIRTRHNTQNLANMKKRYDNNEEYRLAEQIRTKEFRMMILGGGGNGGSAMNPFDAVGLESFMRISKDIAANRPAQPELRAPAVRRTAPATNKASTPATPVSSEESEQ